MGAQSQLSAVTTQHAVYLLSWIFTAWLTAYIILRMLGLALPRLEARGLFSERRNRILAGLGAIMTAVLGAVDVSVPPAPARRRRPPLPATSIRSVAHLPGDVRVVYGQP
jgi:hypothetical protein